MVIATVESRPAGDDAMKCFVGTLTTAVGLMVSVTLFAKGPTSKITILNYSTFSAPTDIADEATLANFWVWAGPGVTHSANGITSEETEGFIVDWRAGVVTDHPSGLPHYVVLFYVTSQPDPVYAIFYEPDLAHRHGYVYLPGPGDDEYSRNTRAMFHGHGFEGHWLHASSAWQNTMTRLLAP
jgi:hypothetical protein